MKEQMNNYYSKLILSIHNEAFILNVIEDCKPSQVIQAYERLNKYKKQLITMILKDSYPDLSYYKRRRMLEEDSTWYVNVDTRRAVVCVDIDVYKGLIVDTIHQVYDVEF